MLWLGSGLSVFLPSFVSAQGSINLIWQPSPDTNVIGYNVYYGTSSRSYTNEISLGNTTSATISGLVGGVTYYITATSYDASGDESDFSNEISYNIPTSVILLSSLHTGSFGGLFYEEDAMRLESSGGFNLSVTAAGKYSGTLQMSAGKMAFSGQFGALCQATNNIARKHTNALVLSFSLGSSNQVLGSVSDGQWTANLYGERNGFQPTNYGLSPGKYTVVVRGMMKGITNSLGNSFGTLTLSSAGLLRFAGTLADGTKLSQSASISQYGNWPLFVPLYSGQGLAMSWIAFTNAANGDLGGNLNWIKPPSAKSLLYQNGLAVQRPVFGSFYSVGTNSVPTVTTANLVLGGALSGSPTNQIVSLQYSKATGTFTGQLRDSVGGKPVSFQGAFLQKFGAGYGFVLGTNLSSPVTLFPSAP
jgi:hypothetical protein